MGPRGELDVAEGGMTRSILWYVGVQFTVVVAAVRAICTGKSLACHSDSMRTGRAFLREGWH